MFMAGFHSHDPADALDSDSRPSQQVLTESAQIPLIWSKPAKVVCDVS